MKLDRNYFPGWVRKSITFTIDDGNTRLDRKFIDIVKPYGIKGTFNLVAPALNLLSAEDYRELYRGFGVSNHCKLHPLALTPDRVRDISEDEFSEQTADVNKLYKTKETGVYKFNNGTRWMNIADTENYCRLIDECKAEIENVFGEGSITTFVWPYCEQKDDKIIPFLLERGYTAIRKTGNVLDTTEFALPSDRNHWSYNVGHQGLLELAEKYEALRDDGELKFFCFGLHSHDYENNNCWYLLVDFAKKYGNRTEEFWYASVEEIFAYEDAVKLISCEGEKITNPTDITLYVKADGARVILPPRSTVDLGAKG